MVESTNNLQLIIINLLAIFYVGVLYTIFGIYITTFIDEYAFSNTLINDENDEKDTILQLIFQTSIIVGILSCVCFIGTEVIQLIPFPLDGLFGFNYSHIYNGFSIKSIFTIFVFGFSATLFNKINLLRTKLNDVVTIKFK